MTFIKRCIMHAHFNMTLLSTFTCVKHPSAVPTYAPCYVLIDNCHCLACDQCDYSKNTINSWSKCTNFYTLQFILKTTLSHLFHTDHYNSMMSALSTESVTTNAP